jgi:glycosyltransferase involved in cell wall biosynthesis
VRQLDETARRKLVLALVGFNDSDYSARVADELLELEAGGLRVVSVRESTSEEERARVAELYLAADIFVLTSRVESYPRVTLEAMHFGLPIISTPCFGVCEQLVEGMSGLFYDYGDTAALSRLLRLLCQDGDRRRALGAAAHDRLARLNSYDSMLDAYESLYARMLDRHGLSASGRPG